MVRALLDGRKTQTRRPVRSKPTHPSHAPIHACEWMHGPWQRFDGSYVDPIEWHFGSQGVGEHDPINFYVEHRVRPAYAPGDLLYVRETFALHRIHDSTAPSKVKPSLLLGVAYHATGDAADGRWRPSIHMPKWAARIWLRVVAVRVERLRDISRDDVRAEGFPCEGYLGAYHFADAWEAAYPGSWDRNDWVWVYEFERVERGEGAAQ